MESVRILWKTVGNPLSAVVSCWGLARDRHKFGAFIAGMVACILVALWLVFSVIEWNFSISPTDLRVLAVLSVLGYAVGYAAEALFIEQ